VSFTPRLAAAGAALLVSAPVAAEHASAPLFRNEAAEVSAASRLLNAYGIVTSTFRSVAHNIAVGGVPNSYHLLDRAIDVARRPGVTHRQIEAALRKAGYQLVESLDEVDHSHFAFAALAHVVAVQPATSGPPAPPAKPLARVAADEHGVLNLDLAVQTASATQPVR
jgi:hypothetical protein